MKIKYTPEAIADLQRLRNFIGVKNPEAARKAASHLLKGIEQLKIFPRMGLEVSRAPEPDLIRDLIIGKYTARYFITEPKIIILRVWHQKEDEDGL